MTRDDILAAAFLLLLITIYAFTPFH